MKTFPIYILPFGIVYPNNQEDISHVDFWEQDVAKMIATIYNLPLYDLLNIPYSVKRARIVGDLIYYGEEQSEELLKQIQKSLNNDKLRFVYDDHEVRLASDVFELRGLIYSFNPKSIKTKD